MKKKLFLVLFALITAGIYANSFRLDFTVSCGYGLNQKISDNYYDLNKRSGFFGFPDQVDEKTVVSCSMINIGICADIVFEPKLMGVYLRSEYAIPFYLAENSNSYKIGFFDGNGANFDIGPMFTFCFGENNRLCTAPFISYSYYEIGENKFQSDRVKADNYCFGLGLDVFYKFRQKRLVLTSGCKTDLYFINMGSVNEKSFSYILVWEWDFNYDLRPYVSIGFSLY